MATKIIFAPPMPDPIMETARKMVPEGFEMAVSEHDDPSFLKHVADESTNSVRMARNFSS